VDAAVRRADIDSTDGLRSRPLRRFAAAVESLRHAHIGDAALAREQAPRP
jgi:hypothetical protein